MTLEQKWDLLWPLSCAVSHAIEKVAQGATHDALQWRSDSDIATLLHMARQLKKAVDHINERVSSSSQ